MTKLVNIFHTTVAAALVSLLFLVLFVFALTDPLEAGVHVNTVPFATPLAATGTPVQG